MVLFDPEIYEPSVWRDVAVLRELLRVESDLLPEGFDDLEDEDHVLDAHDDQEDYYPLVDCDLYDA